MGRGFARKGFSEEPATECACVNIGIMKLIVAIPAGLLSLIPAARLGAQDIWDGVYTTAQAERGKTAFETSCINCHNRDLAGSVRGPALRGDKFLLNWQDGSVNNLFSKIRFSMPATYPDSVTDEVKLDIVAYLLQANGFPAGSGELKTDADRLEAIQIVKKGNTALPNFVLVQTNGCLTAGPQGGSNKKSWILTHAAEPVATKQDAPGENAPAAVAQSGNETFLLVSASAFAPQAHQGETVAVKGLLYREPGGREPGENRLNLTSLQTIAPRCSN
jgi:S-disulfanyl-L-cysteine oxidoreductase SoxD